jgi:hypothetical protein
MTIININNVSGISSITAQSNSVTFYDTSGNLASIGASLSSSSTISSVNGGPISGTRNRLINSAMEIDQRNAGGSVTLNNSTGYPVDRWIASAAGGAGTGTATAQRVADAPAGFFNSIKYTVTNAKTPAAGDTFYFAQVIEGYNIIDFAYGTASAKTVALSFWVKSSLTGTFTGSFRQTQGVLVNPRSYAFNYTINSANTWQYITVTATGDTVQVPSQDNGAAYTIIFDLGSGTTYKTATSNSWVSGNYVGSTSGTNLISTNGATLQITGVQLELGSVATPFERRIISQELQLCQRYYQKRTSSGFNKRMYNQNGGVSAMQVSVDFPVTMRAIPTVTVIVDISDASPISGGAQGLDISVDGFSAYTNVSNGQFLDYNSHTASAEF